VFVDTDGAFCLTWIVNSIVLSIAPNTDIGVRASQIANIIKQVVRESIR
jgi:hypothetical protein